MADGGTEAAFPNPLAVDQQPEPEPATSEADEARAKRLAAMQAEMAAYGAAISK